MSFEPARPLVVDLVNISALDETSRYVVSFAEYFSLEGLILWTDDNQAMVQIEHNGEALFPQAIPAFAFGSFLKYVELCSKLSQSKSGYRYTPSWELYSLLMDKAVFGQLTVRRLSVKGISPLLGAGDELAFQLSGKCSHGMLWGLEYVKKESTAVQGLLEDKGSS